MEAPITYNLLKLDSADRKMLQERIDWLCENNAPDWVFCAAILKFEADCNLPPYTLTSDNFPNLGLREKKITLLEIQEFYARNIVAA